MIAVTDASERVRMEAELRRALDRDEFELHYQPKFTLMNGDTRLIGADALLRWYHPDRGTVPPGSFIAIAAERSVEHTSALPSLMRIPYAVFCLTKKQQINK